MTRIEELKKFSETANSKTFTEIAVHLGFASMQIQDNYGRNVWYAVDPLGNKGREQFNSHENAAAESARWAISYWTCEMGCAHDIEILNTI